jgi:AraC-like DNA-binding protein
MKVLQFTIPVAKDNSLIVQEDLLPYFYNHLHRHFETQITWIIEGEGTIIVDNFMQPFKVGEIYIIGANQPHIMKNEAAYFLPNSTKLVRALNIYFNPNGFLEPILNIPEMAAVKKFIEFSASGLQVPADKLTLIADDMLEVKNTRDGLKLAAFIKLLQEMADVKNWKVMASAPPKSTISDLEGLRMNNVYQYTMLNYSKNIKLNEIADVASMTPNAFCRYFKKHTLKTYVDFLNEIRIHEASRKILFGKFESIAAISYESGFSNAVNFNRVFKKITKKTPLQFRKDFMKGAN